MRSMFVPDMMSLVANPFHGARHALHDFISEATRSWSGSCLDVGCGNRPYRDIIPSDVVQVGLDLDQERNRTRGLADIFYDGKNFPIEDSSFDHALCSQVLEHAFKPGTLIAEIHRILRPGGDLVLTVPFLWPEHEQPWDAGRFTSFGLVALLEEHGFDIIRFEKSLPGARSLLQVLQARLDQKVWKRMRSRPAKLSARAALAPFHFPLNLLGLILERFPHGNEDLYLDNLVVARKRP